MKLFHVELKVVVCLRIVDDSVGWNGVVEIVVEQLTINLSRSKGFYLNFLLWDVEYLGYPQEHVLFADLRLSVGQLTLLMFNVLFATLIHLIKQLLV